MDIAQYRRQLTGLLRGLTAQFILGLVLATLASFDPEADKTPSVGHIVILSLHVLIALVLLVGAIWLATGAKVGDQKHIARYGLVAIVVAVLSGVLTIA